MIYHSIEVKCISSQYETERNLNANMRYMHKHRISHGETWKPLWDSRTFSTTTRTPKANIRFFFCCLLVKWEKEKVIFKKRKMKLKRKSNFQKKKLKTSTKLLKRKLEDAYLTRKINKRFGIQFGEGTLFLPICVVQSCGFLPIYMSLLTPKVCHHFTLLGILL